MERQREYAPTSLGVRDYIHNVESNDVPYAYSSQLSCPLITSECLSSTTVT